jgi:hypothetical protein
LIMVGTLAACSHHVDADADAVLQSPISTVVLDVTKFGLVVVADSGIPGVDDLAALGVWGVSELQGVLLSERCVISGRSGHAARLSSSMVSSS